MQIPRPQGAAVRTQLGMLRARQVSFLAPPTHNVTLRRRRPPRGTQRKPLRCLMRLGCRLHIWRSSSRTLCSPNPKTFRFWGAFPERAKTLQRTHSVTFPQEVQPFQLLTLQTSQTLSQSPVHAQPSPPEVCSHNVFEGGERGVETGTSRKDKARHGAGTAGSSAHRQRRAR